VYASIRTTAFLLHNRRLSASGRLRQLPRVGTSAGRPICPRPRVTCLLACRCGSSPDVSGRRSVPSGGAQGVPCLPRSGRGRGVRATHLPCRQEDLRRLLRPRRATLGPDLQTRRRRTGVAARRRAVLPAALLRSEWLARPRSRGLPSGLGRGSRARRCLIPPGGAQAHAQGPRRVNREPRPAGSGARPRAHRRRG
jgi:hypothetical protein